MDNGSHDVNEREPDENISALHVAAFYNNLPMCQLLVHYGADINAVDIDRRAPIDIANGRTQKFLKKLSRKSNKKRRLKRVLSYLFFPSRNKTISLLATNQTPVTTTSTTTAPLLIDQCSTFSILPIMDSTPIDTDSKTIAQQSLPADQCAPSIPIENNISLNEVSYNGLHN